MIFWLAVVIGSVLLLFSLFGEESDGSKKAARAMNALSFIVLALAFKN